MLIDTRIVIHTSIDKAWQALINFDSYQDWNPFMSKLTIEPELYSRGVLQITPPVGFKFSLPIKVVQFEPNHCTIAWSADVPPFLANVVQGVHKLKLTRIDESSCELEHSEAFSGMASGILNMLKPLLEKDYIRSNEAFKKRAEMI